METINATRFQFRSLPDKIFYALKCARCLVSCGGALIILLTRLPNKRPEKIKLH